MSVRRFMLKAFVLLISCVMWGATASSTSKSTSKNRSLDEDVIFLHVDKDSLKAELRTWPESHTESEHLMTLRIAIGKAEGDKQKEGDNKTPEGIYFAQELIDGKTLPAKYGPWAIPINFPNSVDRTKGKTGYGIWLHGVEKDARIEEAKVTEGCVAFYNADIEALAKLLKPQQTIILISNGRDRVNKKEDLTSVKALTRSWMQDWSDRNLENYISYYDKDFRHRSMRLKQYETYKGKVFAGYKSMDVDFSNLRVFTHESYAVSVMNQDFNGDDRYVSKGRKIIYWKKVGDSWKISHEVFENRRFKTQSFSRELLAKVYENSPSAKVFSKNVEESKL